MGRGPLTGETSMSILNFSTEIFRRFALSNPTVGQIRAEVMAHPDDLFVLHDPVNRVSAVINPHLFTFLADLLAADQNEPAASSGLMDALREGQLTVSQDQPADRVA